MRMIAQNKMKNKQKKCIKALRFLKNSQRDVRVNKKNLWESSERWRDKLVTIRHKSQNKNRK